MSGASRPVARPAGRRPFVGREAEISRLDTARERAISEQSPQLVTVVGPAGVGKSRLVGEWLERLASVPSEGGAPGLFRARAVEGGGPYGVIGRLLRDRLAITDDEGGDAAGDKMRLAIDQVFGQLLGGRHLSESHFLGRFLGLSARESPFQRAFDDQPGQHDRIARTVLRRFLAADAHRRPLVLVLDDLHLADDQSIDFIGELWSELRGSPVVLLAVARPELFSRHARFGEGYGVAHMERIDVAPLDRQSSERLLRELLAEVESLPRALVEDAIAMTSGNPRFLVELVRVFHVEGIVTRDGDESGQSGPPRIDLSRARRARLPVTVEEAIQARIAALSSDERDLLEKAATFGNVFWAGALVALRRADRVADRGDRAHEADAGRLGEAEREGVAHALDDLADRDYLLRIPDSSLPGEVEYVFKHNLERELAFRMTPRDRARRQARLGAQWLETRIARDHTDEQLEFLASLHERGGNRQRAAEAWLRAAAGARARYAHETASTFYQRGLELLESDDLIARVDALHDLGDVLARRGRTREALLRFDEMLRAAWLLDHRAKAGAAHGRIGRAYRTLGDLDRAEHHLGLALDLFSRAGDQRGVAGAQDDLGKVAYLRGDWQEAMERHGRALELRRALGDPRSIALAAHNLGQAARASGRGAEAAIHFDEALKLRRASGDRYGMTWSLLELGNVWRDRGDAERALKIFGEGLALARETGDRIVEVQLQTRIGEALAFAGRPAEAADALSLAEEAASSLGDRIAQAEAMRLRGECRLALGDPSGARSLCEGALALVERTGSRHQRALAHRAIAFVLGHSPIEDDLVEADRQFRVAIDLLSDLGQDGDLMRVFEAYGDLLDRRGDGVAAAEARARAEALRARHGAGTRAIARSAVADDPMPAPISTPITIK